MAGDFSDEEWDVSDDQLQQLEREAILSTQQQIAQNAATRGGGSRSGNRYLTAQTVQRGAAPTSTGLANGRGADVTANPAGGQFRNPPPQHVRPVIITEDESFGAASLDEDGVPLVVEKEPEPYRPRVSPQLDETTDRERWRQARYSARPEPGLQHRAVRPLASRIPHKAIEEYKKNHPHLKARYGQKPSASAADVTEDQHTGHEALQAELEELRRLSESLKQELKDTTTQLHTTRGEIAVVRSRNAQDLKTAERNADMLKKQMQEEAAKHQTVLLSKDAAHNQMMTENKFLKHELDENSRKLQNLQRQNKDKPLQDLSTEIRVSPRKATANLRDGFDDDVIMQMSPGRSPSRRRTSKPNTPTKKRKHPAVDAPTLALRLSGDQVAADADQPDQTSGEQVIKDNVSKIHLDFLKEVLAFRPFSARATIVEALVDFAFPAEPTRPLSSILLEKIAALDDKRLPKDFLQIFITFLTQCVSDKHYKPVNTLLQCIGAICEIDPTVIDEDILNGVLPPLQELAKYNASKRYLIGDQTQIWSKEHPKPQVDPHVDLTACLDVLLTVVSLVVDEKPLLQVFWKWIQTDTPLLLLHPSQRLQDIQLTLDILATSVLPETFGVITSPNDLQERTETYVVDKLAFLLWDPPRHYIATRVDRTKLPTPVRDNLEKSLRGDKEPEAEPIPTPLEICYLRLKVLEVLTKFVMTSIPHPHRENIENHHGTNFILGHVNAITRLVRLLYDEVCNLYAAYPDTHDLHAKLINRTTALLHHILLSPQATAPNSSFDLTKSLYGTSLGSHKFRVVMTRLALGREASHTTLEQFGLDAGVTEETRDLARDIVGEYVTPDEAKQLTAAFGVVSIHDEDEEGEYEYEDEEEAEAAVMAEIEK